MKRKPLLLLMLMVFVPIALLTYVGLRLVRNEQRVIEQRFQELLTERLSDVDRTIADHFATLQGDLERIASIDTFDANQLRQIIRNDGRIWQLFVIDPDGRLQHPDPSGSLNRVETEFIAHVGQIIIDQDLQRAAEGQTDAALVPNATPTFFRQSMGKRQQAVVNEPLAAGWFTWYWGRGLNLIYWQLRPSGHIVGVALDRSRWIADLISILPDTPKLAGEAIASTSNMRIQLIGSRSQPIYLWGEYEPGDDVVPLCDIPLSAPLESWRLQQFMPPEQMLIGTRNSALFTLGAGLLATMLGLATAAVLFYREYARDMREAASRVSFVNQVSHELRTPLTNIGMYADLLDADFEALPEDVAAEHRQRLNVIRSESGRLGRLIDGVLTFARQQKGTLKLNRQSASVDTIVAELLERFRPGLDSLGIDVTFDLAAPDAVIVDCDALEQILGNLINNVEKYAASGGWLKVTTTQTDGRTTIDVSDRGPGVKSQDSMRMFEPFWRGSHELDQAAGTGIGLSIARSLARLHGGDVTLLPSEVGTCMRVELETPVAEAKEKS